jgi:hypothetical protein
MQFHNPIKTSKSMINIINLWKKISVGSINSEISYENFPIIFHNFSSNR